MTEKRIVVSGPEAKRLAELIIELLQKEVPNKNAATVLTAAVACARVAAVTMFEVSKNEGIDIDMLGEVVAQQFSEQIYACEDSIDGSEEYPSEGVPIH